MISLLRSVILNTFVTLFVSFFVYASVFLLVSDNKPRNFKELLATIKNITHVKENIKNMYAKSYNQVELMKVGGADEMVDENAKIIGQSAEDEKKLMEQADQTEQDFTPDSKSPKKATPSQAQTTAQATTQPQETKVNIKPVDIPELSGTATIELDLTKKKTLKK